MLSNVYPNEIDMALSETIEFERSSRRFNRTA